MTSHLLIGMENRLTVLECEIYLNIINSNPIKAVLAEIPLWYVGLSLTLVQNRRGSIRIHSVDRCEKVSHSLGWLVLKEQIMIKLQKAKQPHPMCRAQ